jgi:hypothetical protein
MENNYFYQNREKIMAIYEEGKAAGELRDLNQCMDMLGGGTDAERSDFLRWAQGRPQGILD